MGKIKPIILGLSTTNRCRSQLFEAIMNHYSKEQFLALSAGLTFGKIHPLVIKVLEEMHIPITVHYPKQLQILSQDTYKLVSESHSDLFISTSHLYCVVTLSKTVFEKGPEFPNIPISLHWPIEDPENDITNKDEMLHHMRSIRDNILARCNTFIESYFKNPVLYPNY